MLRDGERLFGAHKTWRGLIAGVLACAVVSEALASGYLLGMGVSRALNFAARRKVRALARFQTGGVPRASRLLRMALMQLLPSHGRIRAIAAEESTHEHRAHLQS